MPVSGTFVHTSEAEEQASTDDQGHRQHFRYDHPNCPIRWAHLGKAHLLLAFIETELHD